MKSKGYDFSKCEMCVTPEQKKDIILQIGSQEQDWMDDPEIINMLVDPAREGEKEFNEGGTITLTALREELGI